MAIGVVFMYAGYALLAAGVLYGLYLLTKGQSGPDGMDPNNLEDFNITTADEGTKVPLTYGIRKVTGNVIYYGNLTSEAITERVGSGKSKQTITTGYKYYLDVWMTLGHGTIEILDYYINEDLVDDVEIFLQYSEMIFSDGDNVNIFAPDSVGEADLNLPGVAWVFFDQLLIGENTQTLPTIHFVTKRLITDSPLSNPTIGTGVNPATVVYDLLRRSGASLGDMNVASFNTASVYWNSKSYGLHLVYRTPTKCRAAIQKALNIVGGALTQDNNGKFYINAFRETDTSTETLDFDDGDIRDFKFQRPMWDVLYTDFVASYLDAGQHYSKRTVKAYNPALYRILGRQVEQAIDLTGFIGVDPASARVWEIMKDNTYPAAQVSCEVPFKFASLMVGNVVTVNHSRFGLSGMEFRVMSKSIKGIQDNFLALELRQRVEALYDTNWVKAGGSSWVVPSYLAEPLYKVKVWQLPFNHYTGTPDSQTGFYLILACRKNPFESGYHMAVSVGGGEYSYVEGSVFSQYGTLDAAYPLTNEIDESTGITYTPYRNNPAYATISLTDAMAAPRLALLGNELIGFATVTLNEDNSITLSNCIRGMFGTTIVAHLSGADIWLFDITRDYMIYESTDAAFTLRFQPFSISTVVAVESGNTVAVTVTNARLFPALPIVKLEKISATEYKVTFYIHSAALVGAGHVGEQSFNPLTAYTEFAGDVQVAIYNSTAFKQYTDTFETLFTHSGTLYFRAYLYINGVLSGAYVSCSTPAIGATTWSSNLITPLAATGLVKLNYGLEYPKHFIDDNFAAMEDLLKVEEMLDVSLTALADADVLEYDIALGKFKNVAGDLVFPEITTTTTTSTTTSTTGTTTTSTSTTSTSTTSTSTTSTTGTTVTTSSTTSTSTTSTSTTSTTSTSTTSTSTTSTSTTSTSTTSTTSTTTTSTSTTSTSTTSTSTSTTSTSTTSTSTTASPSGYEAKTVILDFADNYGSTYLGLRAVDFWYGGTKIDVVEEDFTAYASSTHGDQVLPKFAFITALSKDGTAGYLAWHTANNKVTNERLIVVFDSPITFDRIDICNYHHSNSLTERGVQNTKIYIDPTDAITDTVYGSSLLGTEKVFDGVVAEYTTGASVETLVLTSKMMTTTTSTTTTTTV